MKTVFLALVAITLSFAFTSKFSPESAVDLAVSNSNTTCLETLEYDVEIRTTYHVSEEDALTKLDQFDLAKIRNQTERQRISFCLSNEQLTKEVTVLNPEDIFPDHMTNKPIKTVFSNDYSEVYDQNDFLVATEDNSETAKAYQDDMMLKFQQFGLFVGPFFPQTAQQAMAELMSFNVDNIYQEGSTVVGIRGNKEWTYDLQNYTVEVATFDEGEEQIGLMKTEYAALDGGTLQPEYTYIEKSLESFRGDACFAKVIVITYSNVVENGVPQSPPQMAAQNPSEVIQQNYNPTREVAKQTVKSVLSPNPARNRLNIRLDQEIIGKDACSVAVLDVTGQTRRVGVSWPSNTSLELDIAALEAGFYFVQIEMDGSTFLLEKFVKK